MSSSAIRVHNLTKQFKVHKKEPGLRGSLASLFSRRYETITAVNNVSFEIGAGEMVGFIGPNGAGKTTTLKMLAGLLYPTGGEAQVLGFTPFDRNKDFLKQFSLVMGQKQQLWWDLPLYDSLLLQKDIYEMQQSDFQKSLGELTELLDLGRFLKVQVRRLSLGQRMRAELAAAFIYKPRILFLDEPTIGLDIVVQRKIRAFIKEYRKRHGATIILTSHYLDDVRELAERLVIIDHGSVAYDGGTDELIKKHVTHKRVVLTFSQPVSRQDLELYGHIESYQPVKTALQIPRTDTSTLIADMLTKLPIEDISIEEPRLESVVRELFSGRDNA